MNTQIMAAPRWRHFIPQQIQGLQPLHVPSFSGLLGDYLIVTTSGKAPVVQQKVKITASWRYYFISDGISSVIILPEYFRTSDVGAIKIYTDIPVAGSTETSVDELGRTWYTLMNPLTLYFDGTGINYRASVYSFADNKINFIKLSNIPLAGTQVKIAISNLVKYVDVDANTAQRVTDANPWHRIEIPREYRIQGARPINPSLVSSADNAPMQFQGGYMCTPIVNNAPVHGTAMISDDKIAMAYKSGLGYFGTDSFSFQLVNCMGQPSDQACVSIFIGL